MIFSGVRLYGVDNVTTFTFMFNALANDSSYLLKGIEGLGPPDLEMNVVDLVGEGQAFQSRRSVSRQIIIRIGYRPDYSQFENIAELRQRLYLLLELRGGRPITIGLRDSRNTRNLVQTQGFVSKMEPNIFSKDPELVITIDCLRPLLEDPVAVTNGISAMPEGMVTNPGGAETGFKLRIPVIKAMDYFQMTRTGSFTANLSFRVGLRRGDVVYLETNFGRKSAYVMRNRETEKVNLMPFITSTSDWFNLFAGQTPIKFGPLDQSYGQPEFTFTPKYWGV